MAPQTVQTARLITPLILIFLCQLQLLAINIKDANQVSEYCQAIPYNFATECNITCRQCNTGGTHTHQTCTACQSDMVLVDTFCVAPADQTYYYSQYLSGLQLQQSDLSGFYIQSGNLNDSHIMKFCVHGSYRFEMVGYFSGQDTLNHQQSYLLQISEVDVSFRLFFATVDATVTVRANNQMIYNQTLVSGVSKKNLSTQINGIDYVIYDSDPDDYINKVWFPIKTGLVPVSGFDLNLEVTVDSNSGVESDVGFWAISEFTVTAVRCNVCVTQYLLNLRNVLGIILGVSFAISVLLLIFFCLFQSAQEMRRKHMLRKRFKKISQVMKKKLLERQKKSHQKRHEKL